MPDTSPPTKRSHGQCECAVLRHQLVLADQLARQVEPIVNFILDTTKASRVRPTPKDQALIDAFEAYSAARILTEAGRGL